MQQKLNFSQEVCGCDCPTRCQLRMAHTGFNFYGRLFKAPVPAHTHFQRTDLQTSPKPHKAKPALVCAAALVTKEQDSTICGLYIILINHAPSNWRSTMLPLETITDWERSATGVGEPRGQRSFAAGRVITRPQGFSRAINPMTLLNTSQAAVVPHEVAISGS